MYFFNDSISFKLSFILMSRENINSTLHYLEHNLALTPAAKMGEHGTELTLLQTKMYNNHQVLA